MLDAKSTERQRAAYVAALEDELRQNEQALVTARALQTPERVASLDQRVESVKAELQRVRRVKRSKG